MYGVPSTLPLERFVGDYLFSVNINAGGIHFCFGNSGTICVEGRWELTNPNDQIVDERCDNSRRDAYRVHVLLNEYVIDFAIDAPKSCSLVFSNGHRLTIFDDTSQYESFAIYPDNIIV
jgi:hypothetical protein